VVVVDGQTAMERQRGNPTRIPRPKIAPGSGKCPPEN
jgi:hypothetical protein